MLCRRCLVLLIPAVIALLAWTGAAPGDDAKTVPLKKGDRIVFLGDSITAGGVSPKG